MPRAYYRHPVRDREDIGDYPRSTRRQAYVDRARLDGPAGAGGDVHYTGDVDLVLRYSYAGDGADGRDADRA